VRFLQQTVSRISVGYKALYPRISVGYKALYPRISVGYKALYPRVLNLTFFIGGLEDLTERWALNINF
jgi:hypothetical protein